MLDALLTSEGLIALLTLTAMEIVLGIDNVLDAREKLTAYAQEE
jgi:predicted tellurium resistance membrane protein TerC